MTLRLRKGEGVKGTGVKGEGVKEGPRADAPRADAPPDGKRRFRMAVALVLLVGAFHMFRNLLFPGGFPDGVLMGFFYAGVVLAWCSSMRRRLLPGPLRLCATASGLVMVAWTVDRCFRYTASWFVPVASRVTWYAYYPFQLVLAYLFLAGCVLLVVNARSNAGAAGRGVRVALACLGAAVACLCVAALANDAHQLLFRFQGGIPDEGNPYTVGPLYWSSVVALAAMVLVGIVFLARRAGRDATPAAVLVPVGILLVTGLYLLCHSVFPQPLSGFGLKIPFEYPEACCFATLLVWEWLVRCGLIPSNGCYRQLFAASTVPICITDSELQEVYSSATPLAAKPEQMRCALGEPVMLDADTRLRSSRIRAGHVFWTDDLADVNNANARLEDALAQLRDENELLAAENELAAQRARIQARAAVFEAAERPLLPEVEAMRAEVATLDPSDASLRGRLANLDVRLAVVKRAANLNLVAAEHADMPAEELVLAVGEVLRCQKRLGAECAVRPAPGISLDAQSACEAFGAFCRLARAGGAAAAVVLAGVDAPIGHASSGDSRGSVAATAPALRLAVEPKAGSAPALRAAFAHAGVAFSEEDGTFYASIPVREGGRP